MESWTSTWRREMQTEICFGNLIKEDNSQGLGIDGRITLKWILKDNNGRA